MFGGTPELYHWDSFGNKMEGDLPDSINELTSLDYLYMQNEHTGSMRNHHCKQRFDMAANGKKFNYQVLRAPVHGRGPNGVAWERCIAFLSVHDPFCYSIDAF